MPYPQRVGRSLVTVPCVVASCVAGALGFVVLGMLVQFSGVLPLDGVLPWLALCGGALGVGGSLLGILWIRFATSFSLRYVFFASLGLSVRHDFELDQLGRVFFRHVGACCFPRPPLRPALCGIGMVLLALSCFASRKRAALRKGCVFSGVAYLVEACAEYVGSCIYGWIHAASGNVASYSFECVSGDIAHNPVCGRFGFARAGASGEESFRARVGV